MEWKLQERRACRTAALGVERVGSLFEKNNPGNTKSRGRADHGTDVLGVLERDEQGAPLRPWLLVSPRRKRGNTDQKQGRVRSRDVELLEQRPGQAIPLGLVNRGRRLSVVGDPGQDPVGESVANLGDDSWPGNQGLAMLANAAACQEVAKGPEARVRLTRQLARGSVQHETLGRLASAGGYLGGQPFVNQQAALMRRAGNLVSVIRSQPEKSRGRLPRGFDLGVAVRAFHEKHPAAGIQTRGHAVECLRNGRHSAGDHAANRTWIVRADLVSVNFDVAEALAE